MRSRTTTSRPWRRILMAGLPATAALAGLAFHARGASGAPPELAAATPPAGAPVAPGRLSETGLYRDLAAGILAPGVRAYSPQYPLWSDGARKRRWVRLPEGAVIDARDAEAWSFPIGTRFWKEFRFERRVETRYMQRAADGSWLYATYVWLADGSDAVLAPAEGVRGACATGLGSRHDIPSLLDCRACHDASPSRVLGFDALQLSAERDPGAPHAETPEPGSLDLVELLAEGRLQGSPAELLAAARPIEAVTPRERSALGYLHANCGGCHNAAGPLASLGLELAYHRGDVAPALRTALGRKSRFQPTGSHDALRIAPGDPERSVLVTRLSSRFGPTQMPPLGTHAVDAAALELVRSWIQSDLTTPEVVVSELSRDSNHPSH